LLFYIFKAYKAYLGGKLLKVVFRD